MAEGGEAADWRDRPESWVVWGGGGGRSHSDYPTHYIGGELGYGHLRWVGWGKAVPWISDGDDNGPSDQPQ